ncbi:hypothetical protein SERLA73DRAFT_78067 [Serpula lacrymans var. lacrymans S7.3]|uniref:Rgp1-domain-containing protein n=2 Tax=Serpula lacrymans var. lacrymans TaxID=341189 RepID=F8QC27_SERL3|nr:uncharacterized protein SERLADRAFT_443044 [Serpula lacrymans var. lacrymans S7.9]EGN94146.1 hypothetical protein SERLA73DRAFT_78067 [Serpula lacrymans var. lacrymans S7.3]EGO19574.1 hypothetical protein SERLADRAFT_443044 [Serpula lacrymans var. lacrymans S7.9]
MSAASVPTVDSAIRVVVTPAQSSYFAGEPFSVKITFTNTRTPESPERSPSTSRTHKRGAHSISSAPLARPPTSPGLPRTVVPRPLARSLSNDGDKPARKGLIGRDYTQRNGAGTPDLLEEKRQMLLAKTRSLSVDIPSHELGKQKAGEAEDSKPVYVRAYDEFSPASANPTLVPSPSVLARTPGLSLSSKHPHARKQSVFDGQISFQDSQKPLPNSPSLPSTSSASNSAFSLTLDPIAETAQSPYPASPLPGSPPLPLTDTLEIQSSLKTDSHSYPPRPSQNPIARRPSQVGLGHGAPPASLHTHVTPRTAFSSTFPRANTELILYSYVQLVGTLSVSPLPGVIMSPEQTHTLKALRTSLLKRPVVGGGSMDISSSLHSRPQIVGRRKSHSRSSSLSSSIFSLLSPSSYANSSSTSLPASQTWSPANRTRPSQSVSSLGSGFQAQAGIGLGLVNGGLEEDIDPETPLPTFEVQPAMLAVDLSLAPGESRSYTYTINLPENLPPTFKGRSLKFSYELIVGTCRAGSSPQSSSNLGPTGANGISRIMKVPIRLYNNVTVGKPQMPYDLLWPVAKRRDPLSVVAPKVIEDLSSISKGPRKSSPTSQNTGCGTLDDLREYGKRLLSTFPDSENSQNKASSNPDLIPPVLNDIERDLEREREGGALTGCSEGVEIMTRNSKKVSYDVNKDGVKVAVLTFTKSAYRLGETVLGVVELNDRSSRARVLSLSAILEAQESLPSSISAGGSRHMRRVHAEHYSSFVASTLRTTFSLDIPSDASPAFQVKIGGTPSQTSGSTGGLEWRVRLCLLVSVAAETSHMGPDGARLKQLVRDGPKGEWGTSWKASATIAPFERPQPDTNDTKQQPTTWTQYFVSSFLGTGEREYHDGDEDPDEEQAWKVARDEEADWKEVKVETVECEVPISVWPGNTAFKAMDVVFDV